MWRSLEDKGELRRVLLEGRGLERRKEIKHESQVCLSENFVSSSVQPDRVKMISFSCVKWHEDKTLALEVDKGKGKHAPKSITLRHITLEMCII